MNSDALLVQKMTRAEIAIEIMNLVNPNFHTVLKKDVLSIEIPI